MATGEMNGVLRHLRGLALRRDAAGLSDEELLERFLACREEAAFAVLLRRHGPMVLGVCRRVLRHEHDAEDAFQATFLVLVRKVASLARRELVANWLYGVAHRTALKAKAAAARRQARQRPLEDVPAPETDAEGPGPDLRPLLDQELCRLPDRYRAPVVLCDLEGKSRTEVARQLGCPEGTVSSRLARGRGLLARRLARRGVVLSAMALAAACVPAALAESTVKAALGYAAGNAAVAGCVSAPVAALTEGVLRAMFLNRIKVAALVLLAVGVAGLGGAGLLAPPAFADKPPKQAAAATADAKEKKELGPTVHGVLKDLDTRKNTVSVSVPTGQAKQTEEKTFDVAKDVKVTLEDNLSKDQPAPEGKLADLTPGTGVTLQLAVDKKTVVGISARGPGLQGHIKAVDATNNTITVSSKDSGGVEDKTLTLAKGAKILLSDGLSKDTKPQEGKLADLAEGTTVQVQQSVDRKTALSIQVRGGSLNGTVKGVDLGTNTLTVTVKEDAQVVDKALTIAKEARVDGGKLTDLAEGTPVQVTLSVFDKKVAVGIRIREK